MFEVHVVSKRSERRLRKRRDRVMKVLEELNIAFDKSDDMSIINAGYNYFGKKPKPGPKTLNALHNYYTNILRWKRGKGIGKKKPLKSSGLFSDEVNEKVAAFYRSYEWRKLRVKVLEKYGARCLCCGATRRSGVQIHVDHIKSLRKNWHLRLEFDNLQVLCEICNHGKGNWSETDWRDPLEAEFKEIMQH